MHIVQHVAEQPWRAFAERNPCGNIFHTPEMFQVFARAKGHHPTLWAAVDEDDCPLALLLPVQVTLMDNLLRQLTTRAVVYGGVLCAAGPAGQAALALLLQAYKPVMRQGPLFTELRNPSDQSDLLPALAANGFAHEGHLNYLIDLDRPEDLIWRSISKSGQQRVRAARNKGVIVEEVAGDRQKVAAAYQLLLDVYLRVQVPLASRTLFDAAFDILEPCGMLKIFLARLGDRYIGTRVLLLYKGRMIDWYAGADRAYASYSPNELLVWHSLQWGKAQGFHLFDFGGAGRPDEPYGPREFKSKFGGALVDYGREVCVHAPIKLRLSKIGYQLYRRCMTHQEKVG
jgi:hypothetical protein